MLHSLYAHLWSIQDRGLDAFTDDLGRAGLNAVSYAATYHAVRQLMPANPARHIFYSPRSHAYFLPRAHYGRLAPQPSPLLGGCDPVADLGSVLGVRGMRLKAWVIGCHNSDLACAHPDLAVRNALGSPLPHYLCPAQPEVQEYLTVLLSDLAGHGDIHALELESFGYAAGFEHGAHHEMSGLPRDAFHSRLLALCFCPACQVAAAARGIDAAGVSAAIRAELVRWMETPAWQLGDAVPRMGAAAAAFSAAHPEFDTFLQVRRRIVHDLGVRLRETVRAASPSTLLIDLGDGQAAANQDLLEWADGLVTPADPQAVRSAREVLGPSAFIGCGIYPMAPDPMSPERLREAVTACAASGCDGFNYYNHALMQGTTGEDIRRAISALG